MPGDNGVGRPATATDHGDVVLAVRRDAAAVPAGVVDGDFVHLATDATGNLRVTAAGGLPGSLTGYAEDSQHVSGHVGLMLLAVRQDTLAALAGATGDYIPLTTNALGQQNVTGKCETFDVTLTLDNSGAYAAGEVLAATQEIANFYLEVGGKAFITGVTVWDEDDQNMPMDILFFNAATDIGAENGAAAITDAEAQTKVAWIDLNAADWQDWTDWREAWFKHTDAGFYTPGWIEAGAATTSLWVAAITRDAPTHTASGIKLRISVMYP